MSTAVCSTDIMEVLLMNSHQLLDEGSIVIDRSESERPPLVELALQRSEEYGHVGVLIPHIWHKYPMEETIY